MNDYGLSRAEQQWLTPPNNESSVEAEQEDYEFESNQRGCSYAH